MAWVAGNLNARGAFSVREDGRDGNRSCRVTLTVVDRADADRLCELLGIGAVYGPSRYKGRPVWQWCVSRRQHVRALCEAIYPWMSPTRRKKIDLLLAVLAARHDN